MNWWVADLYQQSPAYLVSWVFWVVVSIVLHELAHGFTAIKCGDNTPRELGHITLNPLVHMPPLSWIMFAICGACWGLMPVNPSRFRRRYDDALVAVAGPLTNVGIAVVMAFAAAAWLKFGHTLVNDQVYKNLFYFVSVPVGLNLFLAMFNLIPVPPLDGSRVVGSFFPKFDRMIQGELGVIITLVAFMLLLTRVSGSISALAGDMSIWLIGVVGRVI